VSAEGFFDLEPISLFGNHMIDSAEPTLPNPVETCNTTLPRAAVVGGLGRNLREAAAEFARRGVRVFPCNLQKQPLIQGGFKNATTGLAQIES
jgi:hypothetical protein